MRHLLGKKAKDRIADIEGIITGVTSYAYSTPMVNITPIGNKDFKPYETYAIDLDQAEILDEPALQVPDYGSAEPIFQFNELVVDPITGIHGTVIGFTDFLYGCRRYAIQTDLVSSNQTLPAIHYHDEPRLQKVEMETAAGETDSPKPNPPSPSRGGPHPTISRHTEVT